MNNSDWANNQAIDDLRRIRCFLAVAEELHFGRAAKKLVLPISTVSEAVRQLEHVVGHALFVRTTRRVSLTVVGESMVLEASRAIEAVANVYRVASEGGSSRSRPLLLGTAIDIDGGELSEVLSRLRSEEPSLRITPRVLRTADQVRALLEQRLHLGFVWDPPDHPLFESHLVGTTGLVAVVPDDHHFATRLTLSIAELNEQPVIVVSSAMNEWTRDCLDSIFRDHGVFPRIVAEALGFDQQVPHVLAGVGIGLTAASISAAKRLPGLAYIPVVHRGGFRRVLLWRRDETHPGIAAIVNAMP
jgi:DNA-binding transcriptional LysR family regulator